MNCHLFFLLTLTLPVLAMDPVPTLEELQKPSSAWHNFSESVRDAIAHGYGQDFPEPCTQARLNSFSPLLGAAYSLDAKELTLAIVHEIGKHIDPNASPMTASLAIGTTLAPEISGKKAERMINPADITDDCGNTALIWAINPNLRNYLEIKEYIVRQLLVVSIDPRIRPHAGPYKGKSALDLLQSLADSPTKSSLIERVHAKIGEIEKKIN